jgi:hypothetical protein
MDRKEREEKRREEKRREEKRREEKILSKRQIGEDVIIRTDRYQRSNNFCVTNIA